MARTSIIAGKTVIVVDIENKVKAGLSKIRNQIFKFTNSISNIGLDLALFGAGGTAGLGGLLMKFSDFEDALLFLRTKVEGTEKQFKGLENTIRELGRTTSFTATQVTEAAVALGQAGFAIPEIQSMLQATLDLSRGARVDLSTSAAILANTLRTFGLEASSAQEVASKFILAARKGTLDIVDLNESLKESSGTFRQLNIPLEKALTLITALASRSLRGTKAGTSLNAAFLNLASNMEQIEKTLGIKVTDRVGNLRDPIKILKELSLATSKMGNAKQVSLLRSIFNIRGGRAFAPLKDMTEALTLLESQIKATEDEARQAAQTMDSKFGGSVRRATSALESLNLTIQKTVSEALIPLLDRVPNLTKSLERLAEVHPNLILYMAALPPIALASGLALLALSYVLGKVAGLLALLSAGVGLAGMAIEGALTAPLVIAEGAAKGALKSFTKLDLFMGSFNPDRYKKGKKKGMAKPTSFLAGASKKDLGFSKVVAGLEKMLGRVFGLLGKTASGIGRLGKMAGGSLSRGFLAAAASSLKFIKSIDITPIRNILILIKQLSIQLTYLAGILQLETFLPGISLLGRGGKQGKKDLSLFKAITQNVIRLSVAVGKFLPSAKGIASFINRIESFKDAKIKSLFSLLSNVKARGFGLMRIAEGLDRFVVRVEVAKAKYFTPQFLGRPFKAAYSALTGFSNKVYKIRQQLKMGFIPKEFMSFFRMLRGGAGKGLGGLASMGKVLAPLGKVLTVGGKGLKLFGRAFGALWKLIKSVDYVRIFFQTAVAIKNFGLVLFRVANGVRRFVFSFSGFLFIVEFLILFGDKIPGIREGLAALGEAFTQSFKEIGRIGKLAAPGMRLLQKGFNDIFAGNFDDAVLNMKAGFSQVAAVIRDQLVVAWMAFLNEIAPAVAVVKRALLSVWELGKLIFAVVGEIVGSIGEIGVALANAFSGAGAGFDFNAIAKESVIFIGAMIVAFGKGIIDALKTGFQLFIVMIKGIQNLSITLMDALRSIIDTLNLVVGGLPAMLISFENKQKVQSDLTKLSAGINRNSFAEMLDPLVDSEAAIVKSFDEKTAGLDKVFDKFAGTINDVFSEKTANNIGAGLDEAKAKSKQSFLNGIVAEGASFVREGINFGYAGIKDGIQKGIEGINFAGNKFNDFKQQAINLKNREAQIADLMRISKENFSAAIVGSVSGTRNALLQARTKNLDEQQLDTLKEIAKNTKEGGGF